MMATPKAKKRLEYPPMTIYVEDDLREWLKKHAERLAAKEGQPISVANIIRRVLRQYRDQLETKAKRK
jgi:hypothetical protein